MNCVSSARLRPASSLITFLRSITLLSGYARNQIGSCLPCGRYLGTTPKEKALLLRTFVVPGTMNGAARVPVAASFGRGLVDLAPVVLSANGISIPLSGGGPLGGSLGG